MSALSVPSTVLGSMPTLTSALPEPKPAWEIRAADGVVLATAATYGEARLLTERLHAEVCGCRCSTSKTPPDIPGRLRQCREVPRAAVIDIQASVGRVHDTWGKPVIVLGVPLGAPATAGI